jgi:hypothetical protein
LGSLTLHLYSELYLRFCFGGSGGEGEFNVYDSCVQWSLLRIWIFGRLSLMSWGWSTGWIRNVGWVHVMSTTSVC